MRNTLRSAGRVAHDIAHDLARDFARDEDGATAIEYCLIAVLIAVAIVGAASAIGDTLSTNFSEVNSGFPS